MKKQNNEHYDIHTIIWLLMALLGWWGCCSSGWCEHFQGISSFGWPESNLINVNLDLCFGTLPITTPWPTPGCVDTKNTPIPHPHSNNTLTLKTDYRPFFLDSVFSWLEKSDRFTVLAGFGNLANSTCQPPGAFSPPWSCPPSCQPWCSSP